MSVVFFLFSMWETDYFLLIQVDIYKWMEKYTCTHNVYLIVGSMHVTQQVGGCRESPADIQGLTTQAHC